MTKIIISKINESVKNLERLAASECIDQINQAALQCIKTIKKGGKILFVVTAVQHPTQLTYLQN